MSRTTRSRGGRLLGGYAGRQLALLATATATLMAVRLVISPLLPAIIADLSIDPAAAGIALSVMWGLLALSRYPGGRLADQLSRKTVLIAAVGAIVAGCGALVIAGSYPVFVLGAALVGIGGGLYMPTAIAVLSDEFAERRGQALGVNETFVNLGGALAGWLAVATLWVGPWNVAFLPGIAILVLVGALVHRWNRDAYVITRVTFLDGLRAAGTRAVTNPRIRGPIAAASLMAFTWQGATAFLPTYLQAEKTFTPALAGNAFTGLFLVGIVANLIVPRAGDRWGHVAVSAATTLVSVVGLGLIIGGEGIAVVAVGVLLLAVGLTAFWPIMTAAVVSQFPEASTAGDYGAVSTVFMAIGSLGSTYVGVVATARDYTTAFSGFIVCLLLAAAIMAWSARTARA